MDKQKITCVDMQEFVDVIAGLVEHGLTFNACATSLIIRLTGGY